MWRRGPFNPTMPVPTEHPGNGAEAHIHSPRRRSDLGGGLSSGFGSQAQANSFLSSMPNTQSFLQRSAVASTSSSATAASYADLFNTTRSETSSGGWAPAGSVPVGYNAHLPSSHGKGSRDHGKSASSNVSMPDFGPDTVVDDPLQNLGDIYRCRHGDQNLNLASLQVPANTHAALAGQHFVDELLTEPGLSNNSFPLELATTLTNSLLNQPLPLPHSAAGTISQPIYDAKLGKENRERESSLAHSVLVDHAGPRKPMKSIFGPIQQKDMCNQSREPSLTNSPPSSRSFSGFFSNRSSSGGEYGQGLANVNPVNTFNQATLDVSTPSIAPSSGEKGVKRSRRTTPASVRAIDDEDEPRRSTPRVKIGFGEGMAS